MAGVSQFMQFTLAHNNGAEDMLCPCRNCRNGVRQTIDDVRYHVNITGMLKTYTRWIYHGKSVDNSGSSGTANDCGYETDESDVFELLDESEYDNLAVDCFMLLYYHFYILFIAFYIIFLD